MNVYNLRQDAAVGLVLSERLDSAVVGRGRGSHHRADAGGKKERREKRRRSQKHRYKRLESGWTCSVSCSAGVVVAQKSRCVSKSAQKELALLRCRPVVRYCHRKNSDH